MTEVTKRPIPGRIWLVLAIMVLVAVGGLALALVLGTHLRDMGPERGGSREGYMQVARPDEQAPLSPEAVETAVQTAETEAQLAALLDGAAVPVADEVSASTVSATADVRVTSASVPLDMPMLPTELPPVAPAQKAPPLPQTPVSPLSIVPAPDAPVWQRNAVSVTVAPGAPMLAIVIDDMGGQMDASRRAVQELPAGVTLSFFPWSRPGVALAEEARADGHEIMIHMPMEALPHGAVTPDPGPDTLRVGMSPEDIDVVLSRNLARLSHVAVGLNNHMGSRFTGWETGMRAVLTVAQKKGMLFVDSKTAAPTATKAASTGLTLPVLTRDVFLDHVPTPQAVKAELNKAALLARKRGSAIAIGHPLPVTLDVLKDVLPQLVSSGIVLVPVTMLVK